MSRNMKINEIVIPNGKRSVNKRNVDSLAQSILDVGLLHPIYIDKSNNLISGQHRLLAMKELGCEYIDAVVADVKADEYGGLLIELAENESREDMSPFDKLALLDRIKEIEDGRKKNKGTGTNQHKSAELGTNVPKSARDNKKELERNNKKAQSAGFASNAEAKRIATVNRRGTESLKKAVENKEVTPSRGATISKLPKHEQEEAVKVIRSGKKVVHSNGKSDGRSDIKAKFLKDNHGAYIEVKIYKSNIEKTARNISEVFGQTYRENFIALISELFIESRKHELKLDENLYKKFSYGFTSMSDGEVVEIKELLAKGMKKMDIIDMYNSNKETIANIDKLKL